MMNRVVSMLSILCMSVGGAMAQLPEDSLFKPYRIQYPNRLPYKRVSDSSTSLAPAVSEPINHQNAQLKALLDSTYQVDKQLKYADGYRIVVYTGSDREQVNRIKEKVYKTLGGDADVYVTYKQPTFQIKVGDYLDRLQAQFAYKKLQELIVNPLIIAEQVNLLREDELIQPLKD